METQSRCTLPSCHDGREGTNERRPRDMYEVEVGLAKVPFHYIPRSAAITNPRRKEKLSFLKGARDGGGFPTKRFWLSAFHSFSERSEIGRADLTFFSSGSIWGCFNVFSCRKAIIKIELELAYSLHGFCLGSS